ncbi:MAG TPA: hypothetical protein VGB30_14250 [bacterium]|jgi:hypothetical protein
MNIPIITTLREATVSPEEYVVEGIILEAGLSENGTYYPKEVIRDSAPIFTGVKCFADHPRSDESERSVRDVVGAIEKSWSEGSAIRASMKLSKAHDWLLTMISEGLLGDLSINALGKTKVTRRDGKVVREVLAITRAFSVDFVTQAAAGGRVERVLSESAGYAEGLRLIEGISIDELCEARPDLIEKLKENSREEFLREIDDGSDELEAFREAIEIEKLLLESELIVRRFVRESMLPETSKEYLLNEIENLDVFDIEYENRIFELIENHRAYLSSLASENLIRGMGSGKKSEPDKENSRNSTLRYFGLTRQSTAPGNTI